MPKASECVQCGADIEQSAGRGRPRKYCGDKCRDKSYYEPVEPVSGECAHCGAGFTGSRSRKYCAEAECRRARERALERTWDHQKRCPCASCGKLTWGSPDDYVICHPCRRENGPPTYELERIAELHSEEVTVPEPGVKPTSAQLGLGHRHRQAIEALKRLHTDGDPCFWCGRPMWLDSTKNWDYDPNSKRRGNGSLQGDHIIARSRCLAEGIPIPLPDRLLHGCCNQQRGVGMNEHLAWGNRG